MLDKIQYRQKAKEHLTNAEAELQAEGNSRLKYVALELRMAMEAITYDRAFAYKDEISPDEYKTWQPKKVMQLLLDIDPTADRDCNIYYKVERTNNIIPSKMNKLGSETVFNIRMLKDHYDAMGSYLHIPTLKQELENNLPDYASLRSRCFEIINLFSATLSSTIFNPTLGSFSTMDCLECSNPVRKRLPDEQSEILAECYECDASYKLSRKKMA